LVLGRTAFRSRKLRVEKASKVDTVEAMLVRVVFVVVVYVVVVFVVVVIVVGLGLFL